MKTLVVLNTTGMDYDEVKDLIQYIIIAEEWESANITPHMITNRTNPYLVYVPSENMLELYKSTDIAELMDEGFIIDQCKDRYEFFRSVLDAHY
jgi:hypothetical protein